MTLCQGLQQHDLTSVSLQHKTVAIPLMDGELFSCNFQIVFFFIGFLFQSIFKSVIGVLTPNSMDQLNCFGIPQSILKSQISRFTPAQDAPNTITPRLELLQDGFSPTQQVSTYKLYCYKWLPRCPLHSLQLRASATHAAV